MDFRRTGWIVAAVTGLALGLVIAVWWGRRIMPGEVESGGVSSQLPQGGAVERASPAGDSPDVEEEATRRASHRENVALSQFLAAEDPEFKRLRERMVSSQIEARGIENERVLRTMRRVPRHAFISESLAHVAYADSPQRIGWGQTISQPYIVALMTELVRPDSQSRALDVGTGSGYQAAVLAEICREVYSIEIVPELAEESRRRLTALGYDNITVRAGDGYRGWPEQAPFDLIIVAAAPNHVPEALVEQLTRGGRLVIPVGDAYQELIVIEKQPDGGTKQWTVAPVAFVPMTGEAQTKGHRG